MNEKKVLRTKDLCGKCAALMGGAYEIRKVSGMDLKVICSQCGRKRYGGTYELRSKRGGKEKTS